jgi:FAD:protein FMN transferase
VGGLVHRVELMMGTAISVDVADPPPGAATLVDEVFAWFDEVDRRFSTYKPDSEVGRLDRGELAPGELSRDMRHVLDACEDLRAATRGYFDAYATGRLDPSGYVKGWSVQVASDRLAAAGAGNHCVNAGGDVRVRGAGPAGRGWRIGIRNPFEHDKVAWVVAGTDLAVATSGTYERGFHVVDPFTGAPATYLSSVTVTGPDLGVADAYATAAVAMGARGPGWLAGLDGHECAVVTAAGEASRSAGLPVADFRDDTPPGDPGPA